MGSRLETNSNAVRKRIAKHAFENEEGEEYEGSKFGGFPEYFRRKKIKLQNLDAELLSYGGGFMQYLDGKTTVTHIIASSLTPKKSIEFRRYRIVKPAWVVDSVKAGRLLPWDAYRVLDEGAGQKVIGFDNGGVVSHTSNRRKGYRDQTEASWYTSQLKTKSPKWRAEGEQLTTSPFGCTAEVDAGGDGTANSTLRVGVQDNGRQYTDSNQQLPPPSVPPRSHEEPQIPYLSNEESFWQEVRAAAEAYADSSTSNRSPMISPVQERKDHNNLTTEDAAPEEITEPSLVDERIDLGAKYAANPTSHYSASESAISGNRDAGLEAEDDLVDGDSKTNEVVARCDESSSAETRDSPNVVNIPKKAKLTAEEHNSELLADPRIRKSSVVNPDFLDQYYRESRLHHLSTWKADLKSQLQALMAERTSSQKAKQKRMPGARRYILHVDFDSFFAAVSLKKYPQWVDKPAVVAHGGGSGSEIASCNYPARAFGIKNGMWMKRAQEMCPDLNVLPYDFPAYERASKDFYEALLSLNAVVQSVSVDEALIDISTLILPAGGSDGKSLSEGSIWREQAKADDIAKDLREQIRKKTGCNVSVGIGGNILLSKLALRRAKPAGQYQIKPEEALDFIGKLLVQDLPGVAYSIGGRLEGIGIKFVRDIRECSREKLMATLGPKTGEKLWDYARGIDRTEVGEQVVRKSVSAEVNWGVRFENQAQVDEFIENLCGELQKRLIKENVRGRQLTMKLMRRAAEAALDPPKHLGHGLCDTFNRSILLGVATNDRDVLTKEALSILKGYGFSPGELRGIGVQMQKLEALKPTALGQFESSQRRLQFLSRDPAKAARDEFSDAIVDEVESRKSTDYPPPYSAIISAVTNITDSARRKPLNTSGTQFILPTQVDESVLAELPEDIKARLINRKPSANERVGEHTAESPPRERCRSNTPSTLQDQPFTVSQLDPDILKALPDAVRAEILAEIQKFPRKAHDQSVLPQSPRKLRTIPVGKKAVPTSRRRRAGLLTRPKAGNNNPTLTQSNFVTAPLQSSRHASPTLTDGEGRESGQHSLAAASLDAADISAEFLAALPEDIRREVLAEHRRERLNRSAGIDIHTKKRSAKHSKSVSDNQPPPGQRVLRLPPQPRKPTFTTRKLSETEDVREAISEWFAEFRDDGPYEEDVEALGKYLAAVVEEERDMAKAVCLVRWMQWLVDPHCMDAKGQLNRDWAQAVVKVKAFVEEAVSRRGLGKVEI